ncbi:hypothetical protein [Streptomyces alkaliterrae]|uniref:HK97 gp10 family phage protein n=1 Tax=Streptomyces alkaliterrae TaxID=2213162 RepID=A0A5P0YJD7_9ACTN|nr:hypothetical protein [Streptomyces alkaliterrae]MBB1251842.1 hypothetical protein [Streptomyces alkaliterrae]MBB1259301.1 hypothetical protein [Streptomyces alkaliterrae]MQS00321.1 hypothetical protein [Streptomyces alkaliterrae]
MSRSRFTIRVEGLRELQQAMRRLRDSELDRRVKDVNKDVAKLVAAEAKSLRAVPTKSGKLRRSIGALASRSDASVKAGSAARVPYAGPLHWGWRRRNIRPRPFLRWAAGRKYDEAHETYTEGMAEVMRDRLES